MCCEPGAMLSWQRLLEQRVSLDVIKTRQFKVAAVSQRVGHNQIT